MAGAVARNAVRGAAVLVATVASYGLGGSAHSLEAVANPLGEVHAVVAAPCVDYRGEPLALVEQPCWTEATRSQKFDELVQLGILAGCLVFVALGMVAAK